jgi:hypothetical protein
MVGITLSPEQIQQAPAEVRRWIEQQISSALGLFQAPYAISVPASSVNSSPPAGAVP